MLNVVCHGCTFAKSLKGIANTHKNTQLECVLFLTTTLYNLPKKGARYYSRWPRRHRLFSGGGFFVSWHTFKLSPI